MPNLTSSKDSSHAIIGFTLQQIKHWLYVRDQSSSAIIPAHGVHGSRKASWPLKQLISSWKLILEDLGPTATLCGTCGLAAEPMQPSLKDCRQDLRMPTLQCTESSLLIYSKLCHLQQPHSDGSTHDWTMKIPMILLGLITFVRHKQDPKLALPTASRCYCPHSSRVVSNQGACKAEHQRLHKAMFRTSSCLLSTSMMKPCCRHEARQKKKKNQFFMRLTSRAT